MAKHLIGAHMPTGKSLGHALREAKRIGCTAVQVFTSSPHQWQSSTLTRDKVEDFKRAVAETGISEIISHDSYLVNLCSTTSENRLKSLASLKLEICRCSVFGIGAVVSHIGASRERDRREAMRIAAQGVSEVLAETPETVMLLAETTAGQGSSLNARFDEIAELLELTGAPERLGVCVDTCHIFAAGYDIRTEDGYWRAWEEFDRLVGVEKVKAIHCNDSRMPFNSKRDRHAHIGDGEIGPTAFQLLVNDERFFQTPIVIETPDAETMHEVNVSRLWSFVR